MASILLFSILGILIALAAILWVRNNRVYEFRVGLIDRIAAASRADIQRGDYDWERRYDTFDAVSYDEMFWQFWKPLRAFYPDMSFTEVPQPPAG